MDAPLHVFEFRPTRADLAARLRAARPRWYEFGLRSTLAAAILTGIGAGMLEEVIESPAGLVAVLLVWLAAIVAIVLVVRTWIDRRRVAKWTPPTTSTRIEVFHDHIAVTEGGRHRRISWDRPTCVALTEQFLVLASDPPAEDLVIPLRAFEDRGEAVAFFGFCEDRCAE